MEKLFPVLTVYLFILSSILFSSCGKENKESDSKSDSVKTDESAILEKNDTAKIINHEESTTKNQKTDSIPKLKVKNEKDTSSLKTDTKENIKVIAYYFHPTARCPTCISIENFTKEVIQTRFEKEGKEGLITFRELNIEDSLNEHYIDDYNLQFSSVILTKFVNNKQVKWKNLEHVWKFANDKEQFFKYASIEIKGFLKEKE